MVPSNCFSAASISFSEIGFSTFFSSTISPVWSSVVVEKPIVISASYVFDLSVKYSTIFVALPIQIGRTPETSGSRVPVWPTFLCVKFFLL